MQLLPATDFLRSPWKNGLGFTSQIAIHPPHSDLQRGDFIWRLSSARIESSSDFSLFPNYERVIVVLSGAGLRLEHRFTENPRRERVDLGPLQPYKFPGELTTHCQLISGAVTDLSIFLAKGQGRIETEVLELEPNGRLPCTSQAQTVFVFVAAGKLSAPDLHVKTGDCLRLERTESPSYASECSAGPAGAQLVQIAFT